jgi:hypothetical protein
LIYRRGQPATRYRGTPRQQHRQLSIHPRQRWFGTRGSRYHRPGTPFRPLAAGPASPSTQVSVAQSSCSSESGQRRTNGSPTATNRWAAA